jgi:hypothetical protein
MKDGSNKMLIGLTSGNGYGFQPGAWRTPGIDPTSYTSMMRTSDTRRRQNGANSSLYFFPTAPLPITPLFSKPKRRISTLM